MPVRSPPHTSSLDGVPCRGHPLGQARATRRRQVSWLTGHHTMHGLPRPCVTSRLAQWLLLPNKEEAKCIALAAYSCRDSLGFRWRATLTAFPFKPLSGHRRDHAGLFTWNRSAETVYPDEDHPAIARSDYCKGPDGSRWSSTNGGSWERSHASRFQGLGHCCITECLTRHRLSLGRQTEHRNRLLYC